MKIIADASRKDSTYRKSFIVELSHEELQRIVGVEWQYEVRVGSELPIANSFDELVGFKNRLTKAFEAEAHLKLAAEVVQTCLERVRPIVDGVTKSTEAETSDEGI